MAVSLKAYAKGGIKYLTDPSGDTLDLDGGDLKLMLCTSSYTPNQSTHTHKSDVTNEVSGTGYTAGGVTLTGITVTSSGLVVTLDADDASWAASTITARYAVCYSNAGADDAHRPLLFYVDFGADQGSSASTFLISWNAAGILQWTMA